MSIELTKRMNTLTVSESEYDYSKFPIETPKDAFAASLHLMMCHVSDFHKLMVKIISEKYKIPVDEIMSVITEHPEYNNMYVNPTFQSLGLFTQEEANAVFYKKDDKHTEEEERESEQPQPSKMPVKRKLAIKKK